jgi:hypothetical protein
VERTRQKSFGVRRSLFTIFSDVKLQIATQHLVIRSFRFFGVSGGVREKIYIADLITKPVELRAPFTATELNRTIAARRATIVGKNLWEVSELFCSVRKSMGDIAI